ncbi:MAG: hypothetical protein B5M55_04930 [Desulfococcus sp. 4484_242]|nr:MAG: hypothetical protein B5M55_04930 [Desulfococcus sp. 4484_242]
MSPADKSLKRPARRPGLRPVAGLRPGGSGRKIILPRWRLRCYPPDYWLMPSKKVPYHLNASGRSLYPDQDKYTRKSFIPSGYAKTGRVAQKP